MSRLMIRFWVLDDDTGVKKLGSPWFTYDDEKEDIDKWLEEYGNNHRIYEQTKYVKESVK